MRRESPTVAESRLVARAGPQAGCGFVGRSQHLGRNEGPNRAAGKVVPQKGDPTKFLNNNTCYYT